VRLFVQMGQRVRPDFTLAGQETAVADLCRLVEGTPLALELAAALLDTESPPQLLAQIRGSFDRLATTMRDAPARHRSLRAVFDHSWALLTAAQQTALPRLALFHGGFTPRRRWLWLARRRRCWLACRPKHWCGSRPMVAMRSTRSCPPIRPGAVGR
jgi:predicted ATPase